MGLAERRKIAEIKETVSEFQQQAHAVVGFELPFEFDTTTFPEDEKVLAGYEYYKDYGMPMMVNILKEINKDNIGKEAFKAKIKSVKLINTSKNGDDPGQKEVSLNEGELLVKYGFYNYSDKVWGEEELRTKIENML